MGEELLMVPAVHKDKLATCAESNGIPLATRHDMVWGDILEPFLDTEFGETDQQRTGSRLAAAGLGPGQIAELRGRFGPAMWMYNFATHLWEWGHLGLFDLLAATHPDRDHENYHAVYWEAMLVALAASGQSPYGPGRR